MAKKEENNNTLNFQDLLFNYMNNILDECEKKDQISSTIDSGYCLSTGLLTFDLVMNGGIRSGWTTSLGFEQSGKTSMAVKVLGSLVKENIPGYFIDAEGSLNTDYTCSIAGIADVEEYFGRKSPTGKGWEVIPKIRYTSENGMEKVFKFIQRILLKLPDKLYRQESKKWYFVFDKSKEKTEVELMKALGLKHDAKLYSQTGRYWCEAPDGKFQVVFILDSLPGLVPESIAQDADEEAKAMAMDARTISKAAKPVRGLLRRKHAVFLPVNQMRTAPGVLYGSPNYEPMGSYVKFASDVRNELESKSVPDWFEPGKLETGSPTKQYGEEDSVEYSSGKDRYMYKLIKNIKNKNGIPFRRGWARIWTSDASGICRGFDPVFDTLKYLESTKQIILLKTAGRREIKGLDKIIPGMKENSIVQYIDFKKYILGKEYNNIKLLEEFKEIYNVETPIEELPDIRSNCFQQIKDGTAFDLMITSNSGNPVNHIQEDFEDLGEEFSDADFSDEDFD